MSTQVDTPPIHSQSYNTRSIQQATRNLSNHSPLKQAGEFKTHHQQPEAKTVTHEEEGDWDFSCGREIEEDSERGKWVIQQLESGNYLAITEQESVSIDQETKKFKVDK